MAHYQNKVRPKTQKLVKMLHRQLQEEGNLVPNETPRGNARMSTMVNPSTIEFEVDTVCKLLDELNIKLSKSNSKYFGNQLSIADILYYWEISTLQHLLRREIVPANTELATWFHESMKLEDNIRQLELKVHDAHSKYDQQRRGSAVGNR